MNAKTIFFIGIIGFVVIAVIFIGVPTQKTTMADVTKVKLETNQGEIVVALYKDTTITSGNFEKLVKEGFYDGVIFHG